MGIRSLVASFSLARVCRLLNTEPLTLPLALKDKNLLVLLPANLADLTVFKQILPQVISLFGENNVYLLAGPEMEVQSIFSSKGLHIIAPSKTSVNWCRLPTQAFLEKLKKLSFDYVFDGNFESNHFAARILLNFPRAVRFGCNPRLGHPYLNLEIKTRYLRDRRLIYRSIMEVLGDISHPRGVTAS